MEFETAFSGSKRLTAISVLIVADASRPRNHRLYHALGYGPVWREGDREFRFQTGSFPKMLQRIHDGEVQTLIEQGRTKAREDIAQRAARVAKRQTSAARCVSYARRIDVQPLSRGRWLRQQILRFVRDRWRFQGVLNLPHAVLAAQSQVTPAFKPGMPAPEERLAS
ncbi:MAG: hypothetical protein D6791_00325 [Chloroflexi bacterium]|nr:MAG: hypothetical protein D6791_00325 [Chloroflexota bacterium]